MGNDLGRGCQPVPLIVLLHLQKLIDLSWFCVKHKATGGLENKFSFSSKLQAGSWEFGHWSNSLQSALHVWKAAQAGAPFRDAIRCLYLPPLAGLVEQDCATAECEVWGLQRSLSADYNFLMERSKAVALLFWLSLPLRASGRDRSSLLWPRSVLPRGSLMCNPWQVSVTWFCRPMQSSLPLPTHQCKEMPDLALQFLPGPELVVSWESDVFPAAPRPKAAS